MAWGLAIARFLVPRHPGGGFDADVPSDPLAECILYPEPRRVP